MSAGESFLNGFSTTFGAVSSMQERKARNKLQMQRDALDMKKMQDDAADAKASRDTNRQGQIQANLRHQDSIAAQERASASRDADPREVLARAKASKELSTLQNPPPLSEIDQLKDKVARAKLEKEFAATQAPAQVPTAKVRQPIGEKGFAEYEVPATDLEATVGKLQAGAYKSPFADQIADLTTKTTSQQAAIDSGDNRTGFLGIGTSRAGIVDQNQKQLMRLQAKELQDMVQKGAINQAEADRRANALMGVK